jgi:two-component system NarL family sensor kinase
VHKALELAQDNLEAARRSVIDLRAAPLEGRTLAQALAELVEEQGSNNRSELSFNSYLDKRMKPDLRSG